MEGGEMPKGTQSRVERERESEEKRGERERQWRMVKWMGKWRHSHTRTRIKET